MCPVPKPVKMRRNYGAYLVLQLLLCMLTSAACAVEDRGQKSSPLLDGTVCAELVGGGALGDSAPPSALPQKQTWCRKEENKKTHEKKKNRTEQRSSGINTGQREREAAT